MNKPVIAIVAAQGPDPVAPDDREVYFVGKPHVDCVAAAGGMPWILSHDFDADDVLGTVDGWLIIGGRDLDPSLYGQAPDPAIEPETEKRFLAEKSLFDRLPKGMPVLGVCYGCQFLNVVRGGTLVQHLPDAVGHSGHAGGTLQSYQLEPGSMTEAALGGGNVVGKSYHHQAVELVGRGLKVTAKADDGTIEGVEDTTGSWLIGVQWHPERTPEDPASQSLFRTFVQRALDYKKEKEVCGTW